MRRLTDFEKEIVDKIYKGELNGTEFIELFWMDDYSDFFFKVSLEPMAVDRTYQINLYSNQSVDPMTDLGDDNLRRYYREIKKFYDALNLIKLLKENGLIFIETNFFMHADSYFPYVSKMHIVESDMHGVIIKDDGKDVIYHSVATKYLTVEEFELIVNTLYQPTASLEIYVQNGYRTEEQKQNDISNVHNKANIKIGHWAVGAALIGVLITGIFSALSYFDSKAGAAEDQAFKEELLMHVHKTRNSIEGIRSEMNLKDTLSNAQTN